MCHVVKDGSLLLVSVLPFVLTSYVPFPSTCGCTRHSLSLNYVKVLKTNKPSRAAHESVIADLCASYEARLRDCAEREATDRIARAAAEASDINARAEVCAFHVRLFVLSTAHSVFVAGGPSTSRSHTNAAHQRSRDTASGALPAGEVSASSPSSHACSRLHIWAHTLLF